MDKLIIAKYQDTKLALDSMVKSHTGVAKSALKDIRKRLVHARSTFEEHEFSESLTLIRKAIKDFQNATNK